MTSLLVLILLHLLPLLIDQTTSLPTDPKFRDFGVQPNNPNVKVFSTYPTVKPVQKDSPNNLHQQSENDDKYLKDHEDEHALKGELIPKVEFESNTTLAGNDSLYSEEPSVTEASSSFFTAPSEDAVEIEDQEKSEDSLLGDGHSSLASKEGNDENVLVDNMPKVEDGSLPVLIAEAPTPIIVEFPNQPNFPPPISGDEAREETFIFNASTTDIPFNSETEEETPGTESLSGTSFLFSEFFGHDGGKDTAPSIPDMHKSSMPVSEMSEEALQPMVSALEIVDPISPLAEFSPENSDNPPQKHGEENDSSHTSVNLNAEDENRNVLGVRGSEVDVLNYTTVTENPITATELPEEEEDKIPETTPNTFGDEKERISLKIRNKVDNISIVGLEENNNSGINHVEEDVNKEEMSHVEEDFTEEESRLIPTEPPIEELAEEDNSSVLSTTELSFVLSFNEREETTDIPAAMTESSIGSLTENDPLTMEKEEGLLENTTPEPITAINPVDLALQNEENSYNDPLLSEDI